MKAPDSALPHPTWLERSPDPTRGLPDDAQQRRSAASLVRSRKRYSMFFVKRSERHMATSSFVSFSLPMQDA